MIQDDRLRMATRFHKSTQKEETKKAAPVSKMDVAPDLDDLMDNWFFGGLAGVERAKRKEEKVDFKSSRKEVEEKSTTGNSTSRLTQEWLEEAKRLVENSGTRPGTPSRLVGSPRFVSRGGDTPSSLERRDPRSRSARRHRLLEGISGEILQKSSARFSDASLPSSPNRTTTTTTTKQWLPSAEPEPLSPATPPPLPPKQRHPRRSRFLKDPPPPPPPTEQDPALSPPRNLVESAHRRSLSASTCSVNNAFLLRRSVDSTVPFLPRRSIDNNAYPHRHNTSVPVEEEEDVRRINAFLKRKKAMVEEISSGELAAKVKVVLSGSSTSNASSMVAAICYAWLLENKRDDTVVVPVMNMRRAKMWKCKQAAWLFQHLGIDVSSLLFANEVDLEGLIMARQLSIIVIGQDVLKTNVEVGSHCTVLTDNYCEVAYNLLQAPSLKKLLLAGILLDTQNLNSTAKFFTNRDAEAVQLLLVGSSPNYRQELFDQLMGDHRSSQFVESMKANYGEDTNENGVGKERRISKTKSPSISSGEAKTPGSAKDRMATAAATVPAPEKTPSPAPSKASETPSRGKNKFSFAKFFGFGAK